MATVLVVDDTLTDSEIITGTLRRSGFETVSVSSSEDAKTKLGDLKPDAIVLDIVLPGESGFEFCRSLKANPDTSDIPVVMCSTKDGEIDRFWGMKQGAASYITKPINPEELIRTVRLLVSS
ncbi:response regulator receiver protein [Leptolyngbya sp. NIES-3755]|nr:response regulator receiver protein [Leptolyngbya sp. NIES-3755]